jgi:hypothetical protein
MGKLNRSDRDNVNVTLGPPPGPKGQPLRGRKIPALPSAGLAQEYAFRLADRDPARGISRCRKRNALTFARKTPGKSTRPGVRS